MNEHTGEQTSEHLGEQPAPLALKVVRGAPTDEELAALVAAVAAKATSGQVQPRPQHSAWGTYWNSRRAPLAPGAGAWRASGLPRHRG